MNDMKETLEEVAKEYYTNNIESGQGYFIAGAKWQAERMYTEEEVIELLHSRMVYTLGEVYDELTTVNWFEQFKKK